MKVLIVEPRKRPREAEIDGSLESMQKTVGGYLQAITLLKMRLYLSAMMNQS